MKNPAKQPVAAGVIGRGYLATVGQGLNGKPPFLRDGERLDQKTFHTRYEAMPSGTRAELIGGIVCMGSPLCVPHGRVHRQVINWLSDYMDATPGTDVLDNATAIMGDDKEPQPDACLYILPEHGGQVRINKQDYLEGAPELVAEVAASSKARDLNAKRRDYQQAGVQEYIVFIIRPRQVVWLVRRKSRFVSLAPDTDGIIRSEQFPGLWLDPSAMLRGDMKSVRQVLARGLAAAEHARFVQRLNK